jgi:hypothetical protein
MRHAVALALGVLIALLGWPDAGRAQAPQSIRFAATILAVDCNAMTVTLDTGAGRGVYRAAGAATFYANEAGLALCGLQQYVGAPASVWLTASGNELLITRLDVGAPGVAPPPPQVPVSTPAPPPAPPAPAPYPYTYPTPPPYPYTYPAPAYYPYAYPAYAYPWVAGAVLGTIVVGSLAYLLVRGASGYLYRYPYYGPYYRYYYRPAYRPYYGPYRYAPAYRWCGGSWCR